MLNKMSPKFFFKAFRKIMIQFSLMMIVCALIACSLQSTTAPTQPVVQDPVQAFKQKIERLQKKYNIPGMSVAVLEKQQISFSEGFGYADIENKIPATADTPYNIASLTKTFGAAILMKLVEEGNSI